MCCAALFLYAVRPAWSVDLFWHLKLGEIIASTHTVPHRDLFSAVQPDSPWVQFQWAWELLAYLVVDALGLTGLRVVHALAATTAFAGLYTGLRRGGLRAEHALLVVAATLIWYVDRLRIRPDTVNLLLWVPLVPFLLRTRQARTRPLLLTAALTGWLWGNFHGGGVLLLATALGAVATGTTVEALLGRADARAAARRWWLALLVGTAAAFLSPSFLPGIRSFASIFGAMKATGNEEWAPAWTILRHGHHLALQWVAWGWLVVGCAWLASLAVRVRRDGRSGLDAGEIILCAGYVLQAALFVRSVYMLAVPLAFALRAVPSSAATVRWRRVAVLGAAAVLLAVSFDYAVLRPRGSLARALEMDVRFDLEPGAFPEQATAFLEGAGLDGGLVNEGRWAGYILWKRWPHNRVLFDPRHHFTPQQWPVYRALFDPLRRPWALEAAWKHWHIDLAVLREPVFPLLRPTAPWELVYKAGRQEVWLRTGGRLDAPRRVAAVAWLRAHGATLPERPPPEQLARAAVEVGARQWLQHPYWRERFAEADRLARSSNADERVRGLRRRGLLLYRAGLYAAARKDLEEVAPSAPSPRVHVALVWCRWATGDAAAAAREARALLQRGGLSWRTHRRLQALLAAVEQPAR